MINNVNQPYQHLEYEKNALNIINNLRSKLNLAPLSLLDNLTLISNLKVKEMSKFQNLNDYAKTTKNQSLEAIFNLYNIKNYKFVFQNMAQGYPSYNELISSWVKSNDQKKQIFDPKATHFSLSCVNVNGQYYWYSFIISKPKDLNQSEIIKFQQDVINLVNQVRTKYHLNPLSEFKILTSAAQIRASEQLKKSGHTRPNGSKYITVMDDINFKLSGQYIIGENVAQGQFTPKEVMESWMNSPGHRANILNKNYKYIGVGVFSYDSRIYWAQLFYDGNTKLPFSSKN